MPRQPNIIRRAVRWVRNRFLSSEERKERRRSEKIEQRQKQREIAYNQWLENRNHQDPSSHGSEEEEEEQRLLQQIEQGRSQRALASSQWVETERDSERLEIHDCDHWPGQ